MRLYPSNLPANPTPEQLAPIGVEPIRETERPAAEPWQQVIETEPVDTDGDGVREQKWTVQDRDLATVQAERIERLRRTRDANMTGGIDHTFADGTTATIPTGIPNEATRMGNLSFGEARELVADGEGDTVLEFEDVQGQDIAQPASEVLQAARKAVQHGQAWHAEFRRHKQNVLGTGTAQDAYEYDPAANGGWPS